MKSIFVIFLLFSANCVFAQKTALMDKRFKQPIIFTDSVTVEQVKQIYIPVSVNDFDTLYANLTYIEKILSKAQRAKMQSFELRAGSTKIAVSRIPMAYGDRYNVVMKTEINEISSVYTFADGDKSNKQVAERLRNMKAYMKTNQSLFTIPYEITPKIYNVVVISE